MQNKYLPLKYLLPAEPKFVLNVGSAGCVANYSQKGSTTHTSLLLFEAGNLL